ncbi:hypothetical protein MSPP1_000462 [Malassezia sp. CBS 17886]|nr:hypothetical protein MSPP1_000462 [Malassezia sp. CBS 17886]
MAREQRVELLSAIPTHERVQGLGIVPAAPPEGASCDDGVLAVDAKLERLSLGAAPTARVFGGPRADARPRADGRRAKSMGPLSSGHGKGKKENAALGRPDHTPVDENGAPLAASVRTKRRVHLPRHRGPSSSSMSLAHGHDKYGVTCSFDETNAGRATLSESQRPTYRLR